MNETVRRPTGFLAAFFILIFSAAARGQSASFDVAQHGHAVGTASYSFTAIPQGYNSTSIVRVSMKGLNYTLSKDESLTSANQLRHVQVSAVVNGSAATAVAIPNQGQILLNMSANGRNTTVRLPEHAGAVFLPDFDPGALETLLTLAVQQNNRNLWAIIPKNAGSTLPIQLATLPDMHGTLNSKTITVHHLEATIAGAKTELFSGPENQLLQAELPQEGFALVHKGFGLQPPSRAPAPPPKPQSAPTQAPPTQ